MKLLIASNNKHKIREISDVLKGKFDVVSLDEENIVCDPEENGETFLQNATIKANAVAKHTALAVLADDTGLCVDALGGLPGVHSARFAGDHDNAQNRKKLLQMMTGTINRKAHFTCVVVLRYPDGKTIHAEGRVDGEILTEARGNNGFGYDSLFFCTELGKTFAEATEEEKKTPSATVAERCTTCWKNCKRQKLFGKNFSFCAKNVNTYAQIADRTFPFQAK